jgi:hypothetical protein
MRLPQATSERGGAKICTQVPQSLLRFSGGQYFNRRLQPTANGELYAVKSRRDDTIKAISICFCAVPAGLGYTLHLLSVGCASLHLRLIKYRPCGTARRWEILIK